MEKHYLLGVKEVGKTNLPKQKIVPSAVYEINDYLELRLEGGETNIYVNGNVFKQCRYLLLNLKKGEEYGDINSIDEAAMTLDPSLEHLNKIEIDPIVEFWGHCSNLQAWSENNYDTRLLHSNIAFPLLKALSKVSARINWRSRKPTKVILLS